MSPEENVEIHPAKKKNPTYTNPKIAPEFLEAEELTDSRCGNLENKSDEAELESECGVQSHILQEVSLF